MPYTRVYTGGADPISASFNFQELASGQSYLLLYALNSISSAPAGEWHLSSIPPRGATTTLSSATTFDVDCDILVNKSLTIEGEGYINCLYGESGGGGGVDSTINIIFSLQKYSGATETNIVTVTTPDTVGGGSRSVNATLNFSIPKTTFKIGDIIRLRMQGQTGAGATRMVTIWTDTETAGQEVKLWMPVRVQL